MTLGVKVTSRAARPARGEPTFNGVWFALDFAEQGPHDEAVKVTSLDDFKKTYGERVSYSLLHDSLELFFAEGGAEAYVAREIGPAPVKASLTLLDRAGVPVNTLRIDALYVGDYANGAAGGLSVQVQDGTNANTFRLIVFENAVEVERFDNLVMDPATSADYAPTRLASSEYVRGVDLNSATAPPADNPAVLARTNLAGGTDDRAAATDAQVTAALALFKKDLGPGQVSAPGRTTAAVHTLLADHAAANNRTAYLDAPDQASRATLIAAADAIDDLVNSPYAGIFGSWKTIPGLTPNTTRAVPGSAFAAAVSSRIDALEGSSGIAPAGEAGAAQYAIDVRIPTGGFSDQDYEDLNDAGVNMSRNFRNRGVQLYGFRSVTNDADWISLTHNRLRVSLTARLEARGQKFVFRTINKTTLADLNDVLSAEILLDYLAGVLFGDTPEEAFFVDTGDTLNTPATAAAKEMHAAAYARFSEFAEAVLLAIIKVPVTAPVAA